MFALHRISLDFIGFHWISLDFIGFHCILCELLCFVHIFLCRISAEISGGDLSVGWAFYNTILNLYILLYYYLLCKKYILFYTF